MASRVCPGLGQPRLSRSDRSVVGIFRSRLVSDRESESTEMGQIVARVQETRRIIVDDGIVNGDLIIDDHLCHFELKQGCRLDFRGCEGCKGLVGVDLSMSGAEVIPDRCFNQCRGLKWVVWPGELREIGMNCFGNASLELIDLLSCGGLKEIGQGSFRGCHMVKGVLLPRSLEVVGQWAFWGTKPERLVVLSHAKDFAVDSFGRAEGSVSVMVMSNCHSLRFPRVGQMLAEEPRISSGSGSLGGRAARPLRPGD
jgi:hypothetical protein